MSGFPQQHNNGWSHEAKERQNFMEQYVTHGHLPPILLPDPTQHHHTSPHHVNQILSTPVDFPSHPVQPLLHNAGASEMHNAASLVRRNRAKTKPWTEEEHRLFLLGLQTHEKGQWKQISRDFVKTKSSTQIASHAQKYFIRQSVSPTKKRRKSIHDITLHNTNGVPYHINPRNSISLPEIQPIHEMQQIQQMSLLNPLDNMTQSEFGYSGIANQQVDEMQQVFPLNPPGSSMTQSEFEYSGIANQQVDEMQQMFPLNPPNNVTHQIGGFENSDIANQQNHEMQQMPLNPPNSMTHQMSGFDSDIAYQQVYGIQPILPVDPSNRTLKF